MGLRSGAMRDALLYAASALAAAGVALTAPSPLDRLWGSVSLGGYIGGAVCAVAMARRADAILPRTLLAVATFGAVAAGPTIAQSWIRAEPAGAHVKSDVLVVEQASTRLLAGRNPYAATLDGGSLVSWPTATQMHYPYLPALLAIGLPRAIAGREIWTDARIVFLALILAVALPAIASARMSDDGRLAAFQMLLVLPTGAPLVFTSGKETFVLALLLASLVALDRGRTVVSGMAAGVAAAAHQLAWLLVPALVMVAWRRRRTSAGAVAAVSLGIGSAAIVPFLAWDARALIEDAVRFPLGEGVPDATTVTPGGLAAVAVPGWKWIVVGLVAAALAVGAISIVRGRGPVGASTAARDAGALLLVALALAPRVRAAYVVFPLNLLLWARAFGSAADVNDERESGHRAPPGLGAAPERPRPRRRPSGRS